MSSCLILNVSMTDALSCQGRVEEFRIVILHCLVVLAVHEKDGRTILWNMLFDGKRVAHHLVAFPVFTKQSTSRALMTAWMRHTYHRIDSSDEVRDTIMDCEL